MITSEFRESGGGHLSALLGSKIKQVAVLYYLCHCSILFASFSINYFYND